MIKKPFVLCSHTALLDELRALGVDGFVSTLDANGSTKEESESQAYLARMSYGIYSRTLSIGLEYQSMPNSALGDAIPLNKLKRGHIYFPSKGIHVKGNGFLLVVSLLPGPVQWARARGPKGSRACGWPSQPL